jgi:tetratricopeptide (TPR) repeat protein
VPTKLHRIALLLVACVFFAWSCDSADQSGDELNRSFQAAKAALAAGDLLTAQHQFEKTIALGLRQVSNLDVSQSRFAEAKTELDEALKFAAGDPDLNADAAAIAFRIGDVKKARELAQSVVDQNPANERAQNVLGRIDLYRSDFPAAIREFKAAIAQHEELETSYFLGLAYLKAKQVPEAQKWFQHLQEVFGDSAALHVLIGRAYSIARFPEPAVAEFRKAIQIEPGYPRAHSLLGYSMLEFRGEEAYPDARVEFQRELKLRPEDYNALLLLGISDVALRDFNAAETALRHAIRLRPTGFFPYLYLGETYSELKRYQLAVDTLTKYLSLVHNPDEASRDVSRAYFLLGQCFRRLGRSQEAQKALENSQRFRENKFRYDAKHIFEEPSAAPDGDSRTSDRVEGLLQAGAPDEGKDQDASEQVGIAETSPLAAMPKPSASETKASKQYRAFAAEIVASSYNDLGVMRAKSENFAEAAEYFKQAAAWNPVLPGLDRNWGLASYRAQLYSEAISPLERQLKASPDDNLVRQLLGLSYFLTDDFAKTTEVLRPFLKQPPADPGLLFAWGTALVRTRQSHEAEDIFRLLLQQNADNAAIHLLLGQSYAQVKNYSEALTELKRAAQLDPRLPDTHYYTGLVYLHQSDFQSAAEEFRSELQVQPTNALAIYHLGFALLSQGQADEAVPLFRQVIQTLPNYESAYFELGRALLDQRDYTGAIGNLESAKKLDPAHDAVYFQLSRAYRQAGRVRDAEVALAEYQKLIESNRLKKRQTLEMENP